MNWNKLLVGVPDPVQVGFNIGKPTRRIVSSVIKMNSKTLWVTLPEILSPKGRLLRALQRVKRHKVKHNVQMEVS